MSEQERFSLQVEDAAREAGITRYQQVDKFQRLFLFYRSEMMAWYGCEKELEDINPRTLKILGDFREHLMKHLGYPPHIATEIALRRMKKLWTPRQEGYPKITLDRLKEEFAKWSQDGNEPFNAMWIGGAEWEESEE